MLTIGGYDSAWLADLVACYILEMSQNVWSKAFTYFKIYRDDGCGLARNTNVEKLCTWFDKFQSEVDDLTDNTVKFTMEIWKPSSENLKIGKKIKVSGGNLCHTWMQISFLTQKED